MAKNTALLSNAYFCQLLSFWEITQAQQRVLGTEKLGKILPRSACLMNCDYLHLYLQFSEVIQNMSLPGPTNTDSFQTERKVAWWESKILDWGGWKKLMFTPQIWLKIQLKPMDIVMPSGFSPPSEDIADDQQCHGERCGPRYWYDWQQPYW